MSKLEVDQIDPQSGTTLTLGTSGDTVSIPAGVSLSSGATLTAPVLAGSASSAGKVLFKEDTDNGTNSVTLIGPAATADVIVTLPAATDTLVGKATTDTLTNKTINASQLIDGTINTGKIANDAVTYGKIQHTTTANRVIGAASAGAVGEVQVATDMVADNAITLAKMASGTDGNIISYDTSGNPVAVATGNDGQVLTSAGAGAVPTFETLPAGGITVADQWRITADKGLNNTANVFDANLEQVDGPAQGTLGSAMSVSSGVFTYPSTGTYLVISSTLFANSNANASAYAFTIHQNSTSGSNFVFSAEAYAYFIASSDSNNLTAIGIDMVNVSNTSNVKTRFLGRSEEACVARGYSSGNFTSFTFIRLGDST